MIKYAKIVNETTGLCEVGIGDDFEYYQSIGMNLIDVQESEIDGQWYLTALCPHYSDLEKLNQAKQQKIIENDNARDIALNQGVIYQNILFDSDTDQKVNLLATVSTIDDSDTIEWYGMNNYSLICTKQDLLNIGELITQLHSFCWTKNAEIKEQIKNASTVEEVNSIAIDYNGGIE